MRRRRLRRRFRIRKPSRRTVCLSVAACGWSWICTALGWIVTLVVFGEPMPRMLVWAGFLVAGVALIVLAWRLSTPEPRSPINLDSERGRRKWLRAERDRLS